MAHPLLVTRNGNATDHSVDDLISQVSGDTAGQLSQSPKQKSEDRIRHRAIRPSARLTALIADAAANGGVHADGGIRQVKGLVCGLKKYTKNSRRPRGRYGRGLPKKGTTQKRLVVPQSVRLCLCAAAVVLAIIRLTDWQISCRVLCFPFLLSRQ